MSGFALLARCDAVALLLASFAAVAGSCDAATMERIDFVARHLEVIRAGKEELLRVEDKYDFMRIITLN